MFATRASSAFLARAVLIVAVHRSRRRLLPAVVVLAKAGPPQAQQGTLLQNGGPKGHQQRQSTYAIYEPPNTLRPCTGDWGGSCPCRPVT